MFRLYLNPEHPPGSTLTLRPALSTGTCSAPMNFLTSSAARSVIIRLNPWVATCG
jgi:hypothetical protein